MLFDNAELSHIYNLSYLLISLISVLNLFLAFSYFRDSGDVGEGPGRVGGATLTNFF